MSYYLVGLALLSTLCLADKPSSDYGAPAQDYEPPVKYGGPIVYSGEKPPIIHFPPPPSDVSYKEDFMFVRVTLKNSIKTIKTISLYIYAKII